MCGICGILVDRPRTVGGEERGVYLGHTRLAIIDLSPQARQPMTSENGDLHLVCNGEIYNPREPRRDLEKRGHRFRSSSDSEVILHLYEEEGARMVRLLDGMLNAYKGSRPVFLYPIWSLLVLSLWHDRWIAGRRER